MSVGQIIKFYRKEKGFTQSELAEIIGVSIQAVSKWENDVGMPDISQIVPLARALHISTDTILEFNKDAELEDIISMRETIGHHPVDFSFEEAERIYKLAHPFFEKHPTNSEVAFWCLESLSVLLPQIKNSDNRYELLKECIRYENCIFRYETNADMMFKSYYVLSRCYKALGELGRADEIMERIPSTFGDRAYWEAEFAYAEKDMDLAIEKCKLSFHDKARYISRCIRLVRRISIELEGEDGIQKQLNLNEYMLTLINAFLSGGEYLPHRMMYQKMSLLSGMVKQYVDFGMINRAIECMEQLIEARNRYFDFIRRPDEKHCLMFLEGDDDGIWHLTPERIEVYIESAWEKLSSSQDTPNSEILRQIESKI
ncbi:MAG: helix-turn-helix transcriptional regulator [Ruminococcaceae bacterium]|nr:helix-turn-helix transcriptional regulator [Oscillospiraceae bacterium]